MIRIGHGPVDTDYTTYESYRYAFTEPCPCCDGTGIQTRCDGIKVICPECCGSGQIERERCWYRRWPRRRPWEDRSGPFLKMDIEDRHTIIE